MDWISIKRKLVSLSVECEESAYHFTYLFISNRLRHFLTTSGFRLPGEAQRIDRVMNTFSRCFFEDNAGDLRRCPFKTQDTVYVLSFAILMLNTDLHKTPHVSRKASNKMTKVDFINNLKGVEDGSDIQTDYLSALYDSINAVPIARDNVDDSENAEEGRDHKIQALVKNVRSADSLLRGLAVHEFKFVTIDDVSESLDYSGIDALSDLTRTCVSKTWHQWHGVINTGMETAHLDPQGMEPSVEILLYSLAATICLDMTTERSAFLTQLSRLRVFEERRQGTWVSASTADYRKDPWFMHIERACKGSPDRKLWALGKIRELIHSLQDALSVDVLQKEDMARAVSELKNSDFLLNDPARAFLHSGDLTKKSARTGRPTNYRFYLFSDVLLYGSKDPDGRYKIHEELPLHLMKILDWFPVSQRNRLRTFQVHHPRKSFQVVCPSEEDRRVWVKEIRVAIKLEMERKMKMEAARLSLYARLRH